MPSEEKSLQSKDLAPPPPPPDRFLIVQPPPPPGRITRARQTRRGPLQPWMRAYARWICQHGQAKHPKVSQRTAKASELAGFGIHRGLLKDLESRPDFIALVTRIEGNAAERAKEQLVDEYEWYVQAHRAGLEMALREKDHRAVAAFTNPILDRVVPKKQEHTVTNQTISISMSGAQLQRLHDEEEPEIIVEKPEVVEDESGV